MSSSPNEILLAKYGGRLQQLVDGSAGVSLETTNKYRVAQGLDPLKEGNVRALNRSGTSLAASVRTGCGSCGNGSKPRSRRQKEWTPTTGPGTELTLLWAKYGADKCPACQSLALQMNRWGVAGCYEHINEIVADVLPRARNWLKEEFGIAAKAIPDAMLWRRVRTDIYKAIEIVEFRCLPEITLPPAPTNSDRTVVIMAGGRSTRWRGECAKQLTQVNGEPVLYRTVRLLRERGIEPKVSERYSGQWPGLDTHAARSHAYQIDRVWNSRQHAPAIFLYGDTYYTEEAIDEILACEQDWAFFGRRGQSRVKSHGEIFGIKVNDFVLKKAEELRDRHAKGRIRMSLGWNLYHACIGSRAFSTNPPKHDRFIDIRGCEDFDTVEDAHKFVAHQSPKTPIVPCSVTAEDVQESCTFIVTSFKRTHLLPRFIDSVQKHYPKSRILIGDSSCRPGEQDVILEQVKTMDWVEVLHLPFDCGLPAMRNALVKGVNTEYVVLCEDDFEVISQTHIERMLSVLQHADNAILCAGLVDYGAEGIKNWPCHIHYSDRKVSFSKLKDQWREHDNVAFRETGLALNFFIARTHHILQRPWDERYTIGAEHTDWFIQRALAGDKCYYTDESVIGHYRVHQGQYKQWRKRDTESRKKLVKKWGRVSPPPFSVEYPRKRL